MNERSLAEQVRKITQIFLEKSTEKPYYSHGDVSNNVQDIRIN
jgi:hypothetical protein